jgi:hypothetical protein
MQLMLYLLTMQFVIDYTVQGSNTGGGEIFCPHPNWPWDPPSLLFKGYQVISQGVKRPGRGVNHSPPSSAEVKERVQLYLTSTPPLCLYGMLHDEISLLLLMTYA